MDGLDQQAMESVPDSAFEDEQYGVSAQLDPLTTDHVGYPLPPVTSYGPAEFASWNPYLGSTHVHGTAAEHGFNPSYMSAASTHGIDASAAEAQGRYDWSVGLQNYQHPTEGGLEYEYSFQGTIDPICTDIHSDYIVQQPDSNDVRPYDDQQLLPGQQYDYQDAVSNFPPASLSTYSYPGSPQHRRPGMTKEQLAQQDELLHQQSAAHLRQMSRRDPIAGTKRVKADEGAAPHSAGHVNKRRGRDRKSQPASDEPVLAPTDVWTPPTPLTFNASHSSSSMAEGTSSTSPALYKRASNLSTTDGFNFSRRESFEGRRPLSLRETSSGDKSDRMEYVLSPTQMRTGSLGLLPSPGTTVSSTALSTPNSSTHPGYFISPTLKTHQPTTRPSLTPTTITTPKPTSATIRRASAQHLDLDSTPAARRYSSAISHRPEPDPAPDPGPTPQPRRVSVSAADQKVRNRAAATKCRLKTKAAISRLEVEESAASRQNAALAAAVAQLREEAYVLRSQLLLHTDCDCKLIQQYLGNRARELGDMAAKESEGAAGGRDAIEAETGRRTSGQGKNRGWDDNDEGAEVFGSDDDGDYDSGEEEEEEE